MELIVLLFVAVVAAFLGGAAGWGSLMKSVVEGKPIEHEGKVYLAKEINLEGK